VENSVNPQHKQHDFQLVNAVAPAEFQLLYNTHNTALVIVVIWFYKARLTMSGVFLRAFMDSQVYLALLEFQVER